MAPQIEIETDRRYLDTTYEFFNAKIPSDKRDLILDLTHARDRTYGSSIVPTESELANLEVLFLEQQRNRVNSFWHNIRVIRDMKKLPM